MPQATDLYRALTHLSNDQQRLKTKFEELQKCAEHINTHTGLTKVMSVGPMNQAGNAFECTVASLPVVFHFDIFIDANDKPRGRITTTMPALPPNAGSMLSESVAFDRTGDIDMPKVDDIEDALNLSDTPSAIYITCKLLRNALVARAPK